MDKDGEESDLTMGSPTMFKHYLATLFDKNNQAHIRNYLADGAGIHSNIDMCTITKFLRSPKKMQQCQEHSFANLVRHCRHAALAS